MEEKNKKFEETCWHMRRRSYTEPDGQEGRKERTRTKVQDYCLLSVTEVDSNITEKILSDKYLSSGNQVSKKPAEEA